MFWNIAIPVILVLAFEFFLLWDSARYYDTIKKKHNQHPQAFKTPKGLDDKLKVIDLDEWEVKIS